MVYPKFECLFCPHCCRFNSKEEMPIVFYWEKEKLLEIAKRYGFDLTFEEFLVVEDGSDDFVYLYRWIIDGVCPFFRNNKCSIHSEKPLSCSMFPLILEIPNLRIHLSHKCDWVRKNIDNINPEGISSIFPKEFSIVARVAAMLEEFLAIAKSNGWRIIIKNR